jgi:predicted nucleotide-binding protein
VLLEQDIAANLLHSWLIFAFDAFYQQEEIVKIDDLREFLKMRQVPLDEDRIQNATRLKGPDGEIFCLYDTGRFVLQGNRKSDLAVGVHEWATKGPTAAGRTGFDPEASDAPVFIVYGHDIAARDNLELLLRRMGLEPIVLANLPAAGDTIIEKLERYIGEHGNVGYACVLLTPDDQGHKAGQPEEIKYRARQNVVLELGMVLSRLGRPRVAILHKQSVELPSDIAGLIYIAFQERVDEVRTALFKELQNAGYKPKASAL